MSGLIAGSLVLTQGLVHWKGLVMADNFDFTCRQDIEFLPSNLLAVIELIQILLFLVSPVGAMLQISTVATSV